MASAGTLELIYQSQSARGPETAAGRTGATWAWRNHGALQESEEHRHQKHATAEELMTMADGADDDEDATAAADDEDAAGDDDDDDEDAAAADGDDEDAAALPPYGHPSFASWPALLLSRVPPIPS